MNRTHFAVMLDPSGGSALDQVPRLLAIYATTTGQLAAVVVADRCLTRDAIQRAADALNLKVGAITSGPTLRVRATAVRRELRIATQKGQVIR